MEVTMEKMTTSVDNLVLKENNEKKPQENNKEEEECKGCGPPRGIPATANVAACLRLLTARSIFSNSKRDHQGYAMVEEWAVEALTQLQNSSDEAFGAAFAEDCGGGKLAGEVEPLVKELVRALPIWHGPEVDLPLFAVMDKLAANTLTSPFMANSTGLLSSHADRYRDQSDRWCCRFTERLDSIIATISRVSGTVKPLNISEAVPEERAASTATRSLSMFLKLGNVASFESSCKVFAAGPVHEAAEAVKSLGSCGLLLPVTEFGNIRGDSDKGRCFQAALLLIQAVAEADHAAAVEALKSVAPKGCDGCVWLGLMCMAARWRETSSAVERLMRTLAGDRGGRIIENGEVRALASSVRDHYCRADMQFPYMGNCLDFKAPIGCRGEKGGVRRHASVLGSLLVSKHLPRLMAADEDGAVVLARAFLGPLCTTLSFDKWFEEREGIVASS